MLRRLGNLDHQQRGARVARGVVAGSHDGEIRLGLGLVGDGERQLHAHLSPPVQREH